MKVEDLLQELRELVEDAKVLPLSGGKCLIDAENKTKNSDRHCTKTKGNIVYVLFSFIKSVTVLFLILFKNLFFIHDP